jgi:hypothetical protein
VLAHQPSATDLLFITLRKSEALFSPSTRYRDLALGPALFHWQSQSTTTAASATGQRTILQLDDDVLAAARVLARQQRTSLGAVISELARQALVAPAAGSGLEHLRADHRNGLPLLPWKETGAPVDLELVNNLRDELV